MKNIEKNLWLILFPRIVLGLFIVLNIIAILSYSGGTFHNSLNPGYSFTRNFLSDLGRTVSFSGEVNFLSAQLFNMSLFQKMDNSYWSLSAAFLVPWEDYLL